MFYIKNYCLIGLEALWKIVYASRNSQVGESAASFLITIHLSLGGQINGKDSIWKNFVSRCMELLQSAVIKLKDGRKDDLDTKNDDLTELSTKRIVDILSDFLDKLEKLGIKGCPNPYQVSRLEFNENRFSVEPKIPIHATVRELSSHEIKDLYFFVPKTSSIGNLRSMVAIGCKLPANLIRLESNTGSWWETTTADSRQPLIRMVIE